ncbi:hypothetical protein KIN20_031579 [Parelaphostrongylus tenuis]|uniref:Uncharacterized protein n=1 Tax=Parelaphostrongylus tenuis TaxID=148309 RepID=A0AAD5M9A9_PARTN|nr:hypothetical protein KIN20_011369 [Parelaphostrongylus tenuis]KAJ1369960.1 hypothetical protein KIN20_031579 [Parelaphostrongylus tenuis]
MMLSESLKRGRPTRLLLHAKGKNGSAVGARSSHSTINGTTGKPASYRLPPYNHVYVRKHFFSHEDSSLKQLYWVFFLTIFYRRTS